MGHHGNKQIEILAVTWLNLQTWSP